MTVALWMVIVLLGVIGVCSILMTLLLFATSKDLRRGIFQCNQTFQEARRTLGVAHRLLARADRAAQQVEEVVEKGCHTASGILHQVSVLNGKARTFLRKRLGNGARFVSRRSVR